MSESGAVARVLASGFLIDAKAFELIDKLPREVDLDQLAERILALKEAAGQSSRLVTEEDVVKALPNNPESSVGEPPVVEDEPVDLEVVSDPTQSIAPEEAPEGFNKLFVDRYNRLYSIVKERLDSKGLLSVASAGSVPEGKKVRVAGLLSNRNSRRSNVEVTIDDPSGSLNVICQDEMVAKVAMKAPLDAMVVLELSRSRAGSIYANSILLPDIPARKPVASSHRVYAVLLSDLHIGSKMFLADDFKRFLRWLNGEFGDRDVVDRIKYLVVAGDLVDGVGVYPGQEFQLAEKDPEKQYESAASLLKSVPNSVQIVLSPGNHDAVRQALPQPAVSPELAGSLYGMENVRWVGDPSYVKLHGVLFLIYHGKSMDDIIATTPDLTYNNPTEAMKLLLRSRHLAPTYGKRTALSPELRDFMVIDPVPDVLHSGHVHTYGERTHRGTLLVNSGTWQAQTNFQMNMGIEPTPSIVPILDLSTLEVSRRNFGPGGFPA